MPTQEQVFTHWHIVDKLAGKRFKQEAIAEEAALFVLNSLEKDDWKKLKQFSGKAAFSTFFSSVTYRLLEDFARKKYGRVTPPKWIKEAGGIWLLLFRLLCLERYSFIEAVHLAKERISRLSFQIIESAAETVLGKIPNCGKSDATVTFEDEVSSSQLSQKNNTITVEDKQKNEYLAALAMAIFDNKISENYTPQLLRLLEHSITLKSEERLLLKLCYKDNYSVSEAGKKIGLNRFQAHGRLKRTLEKIKKQFQVAGYEEELKLFLQSS